MRWALAGLAAWALLWSEPAAAEAPAPARTRYTLEAQLLPRAHKLRCVATIDFANTTTVPVRELMLHLYPNAFASKETVFAHEGGWALRGQKLKRNGSLALHALTSPSGADLLAHANSELVPNDRTQLRVPLPEPVAPGARLAVRASFEVMLPTLVARMGSAHGFHMLAQWFPKLAKLMPDGTWRSTPYHGAGEFDADFADYDLTVRIPKGFVVAAPGVRKRCSGQGAERCERYVHQNVLDIAWAAAEQLQRIDHKRKGSAITVEAYAPLGARALAERQAELAARALDELSAVLGPYPHERLVLVIPPETAVGAAGMEYPGLIMGWTASAWSTLAPALSQHDVVTAHEIAHQWFPMIVASNEVQSPVLDEGLAEWLGLHVLRDRYGHASEWTVLGMQAAQWLGLPLDAFDIAAASLATRSTVPSSWKSAADVGLGDLGHAMYLRPAVALEALARQHGRPRLLRALGRYAREHRFRYVKPSDLENALDAEYGAGFADDVFVPALAGEVSALTTHEPDAAERDAARALPGRVIALVQLALGWLAP